MKKILFFYFILFILVSTSSAATLTLSPPQLDFYGNTQELICKEFKIKVDGMQTLTNKVLWAKEGFIERKLNEHNLKGDNLGIELSVQSPIIVDEESIQKICIKSNSPGNFHGILLYKIYNKPIQVGLWLNLSIKETKKSFLGMTGAITMTGETTSDLNSKKIFWFTPIILAIILFILFSKLDKKISKK